MWVDKITLQPSKGTSADYNAIIEVPIGGEPVKYELDKISGALVVDRFLYTATRYPGNYGLIPHTLSGDGDPCDVIVLNSRPLVPGAVISVRPVGVLFMTDEAGEDEKIIAVPSRHLTARYDKIFNYTDLPAIQIEQVAHFFQTYKALEPGKWVKISRIGDATEAQRVIAEGVARAQAVAAVGKAAASVVAGGATAVPEVAASSSAAASAAAAAAAEL